MFDAYLIKDGSFQNYEENGEAAGFKVDVHIGEYRGCFLSLVRGYYVEVDGVEYPLETQKFEINNKAPRTFEEIAKAAWEEWIDNTPLPREMAGKQQEVYYFDVEI